MISTIINGDWLDKLKTLDAESVQCCVTSPPYWGLRDYGVHGQLGLEKTPEEYVEKMVSGFREVKRVLRNDGTLWLNLGDTYSSSGAKGSGGQKGKQATNVGSYFEDIAKNGRSTPGIEPKNLVGIPWRVAFALQSDGWYLRQDIIWHKPNPMPESVTDRCTKSHEYIFLLTKSARYYYDNEAIKEQALDESNKRYSYGYKKHGFTQNVGSPIDKRIGTDKTPEQFTHLMGKRNRRSVWSINTHSYSEAHFATFPQEIPRTCILAGSKEGDTILDPFTGSGTTGEVALKLNRNFIGIELNEKYVNDLIIPRLDNVDPLFRMFNEA